MSLATIFITTIIVIGLWPLFFTSGFDDSRRRVPSIITLIRILFVLCVVLLLLIWVGAIPNKIV